MVNGVYSTCIPFSTFLESPEHFTITVPFTHSDTGDNLPSEPR